MPKTRSELYQEYLEKSLAQAKDIIQGIKELKEIPYPKTGEEAREQLALKRLEGEFGALDRIMPEGFTDAKAMVATLIGKGLTIEEVVKHVAVEGGISQVYRWMTDPEFQKTLDFWRSMAEEENRAVLVRELAFLAESEDIEPELLTKITNVRLRFAQQTEERSYKRAALMLREREVSAKEKMAQASEDEVARKRTKPTWVKGAIDVEAKGEDTG